MFRSTTQAVARSNKITSLLTKSRIQHQSVNFKSSVIVPQTTPDILYTGVSIDYNSINLEFSITIRCGMNRNCRSSVFIQSYSDMTITLRSIYLYKFRCVHCIRIMQCFVVAPVFEYLFIPFCVVKHTFDYLIHLFFYDR